MEEIISTVAVKTVHSNYSRVLGESVFKPDVKNSTTVSTSRDLKNSVFMSEKRGERVERIVIINK